VGRSYHAARSGDLEILLEPFWVASQKGTTHGTPYSYDTHVPLIFMGHGIRPGRYNTRAVLNDVAPTLATLLSVEIPSNASGRVLDEMFSDSP
jgi:arylsulfatase A-like enzyme